MVTPAMFAPGFTVRLVTMELYELTFDVTLVLRAESEADARSRAEQILNGLRLTPDAFLGFEMVEDEEL